MCFGCHSLTRCQRYLHTNQQTLSRVARNVSMFEFWFWFLKLFIPSILIGNVFFWCESRHNCSGSVFPAHCSTHNSLHTHLPPVTWSKNIAPRTKINPSGPLADEHRHVRNTHHTHHTHAHTHLSPDEASWSLRLVLMGMLLSIFFLLIQLLQTGETPTYPGAVWQFYTTSGSVNQCLRLLLTQTYKLITDYS